MTPTLSDLEQLERRFPEIAWREPVPVTTPEATGLACRVCIALYGLRGSDVPSLPLTRAAWDEHFEEHFR